MNDLKDTRELVTTTSAPDNWVDSPQPRARFIAGYLEDLIHLYPNVELASIRITEFDAIVTVTGRRGPIAAEPECPSCHTVAGHPHTEYCQLANWAGHRDNCALQWGKPCDCVDQAEPAVWVDNGCRCPNPDARHLDSCPAIDPPLSSSLPD